MDDILLIGSDVYFIDTVKISLQFDFDERLRLNSILGIMIYLDKAPNMVKSKYIDEILNWFNMEMPRKCSWRMVYVSARFKCF